jgi:hypothetical protein
VPYLTEKREKRKEKMQREKCKRAIKSWGYCVTVMNNKKHCFE